MSDFKSLANSWLLGIQPYEPGRPIEEVARELGFRKTDEIVKLASNENALGPSTKALAAMRRAAKDMHRYPDGGCFLLHQALSAKLSIPADHLIFGNGSNELLELLGHSFLGAGTSIVMADRAFVVYRLIAASCRASVIDVPMKDYVHDLDGMLDAIRGDTRIVFIANPNNPTSTVVTPADIDRFMEKVPESVIVCFDEAYVELLDPKIQPDTMKFVREGRKVVILRTFSKTYGLAGLRLGYAIAPPDCVSVLERARQPFNVNAMAQAAAVAALDDDAYVRRTRVMIRRGLSYMESHFQRMGLPYVPATANFVLVKVGRGRETFELMQKEGVIVRPMDVYGLPDHIRITVGTESENTRCIRALKNVLRKRDE